MQIFDSNFTQYETRNIHTNFCQNISAIWRQYQFAYGTHLNPNLDRQAGSGLPKSAHTVRDRNAEN